MNQAPAGPPPQLQEQYNEEHSQAHYDSRHFAIPMIFAALLALTIVVASLVSIFLATKGPTLSPQPQHTQAAAPPIGSAAAPAGIRIMPAAPYTDQSV